ncbi:MAG: YgiT-type zinc finger protein [Chloroflexota bacterium]
MTSGPFADLKQSSLCEGEITETTTTLNFEFDGVTVIVTNVPAAECPGVDDLIVPGPLAVKVHNFARRVAEAAQDLREEDSPMTTTAEYPHYRHRSDKLTPA